MFQKATFNVLTGQHTDKKDCQHILAKKIELMQAGQPIQATPAQQQQQQQQQGTKQAVGRRFREDD